MNTNKNAPFEQRRFHSVVCPPSAPFTESQVPMDPAELHRAIRLPEVLHITGLSRSTWYALLNPRLPTHDSEAPRQFKLGNSSAWWLCEVLAYLQAKSKASRVH